MSDNSDECSNVPVILGWVGLPEHRQAGGTHEYDEGPRRGEHRPRAPTALHRVPAERVLQQPRLWGDDILGFGDRSLHVQRRKNGCGEEAWSLVIRCRALCLFTLEGTTTLECLNKEGVAWVIAQCSTGSLCGACGARSVIIRSSSEFKSVCVVALYPTT